MEEQVLELRNQGIGFKRIARMLHVSTLKVSDILVKAGIIDHIKIPKELDISKIVEEKHIGIRKLAAKYKLSRRLVRNIFKINGIEVAPTAYHAGYTNKIDHTYFENIDNEHKAYWFGFLLADGYNDPKRCSVEIALKLSDKEHLEKLKSDVGCSSEIRERISSCQTGTFESCRLLLNSKQISEDLLAKGVVRNKSLVVTFPESDILPEGLIRHFVRGFYDGNGCLAKPSSSTKLSIDSTEDFCKRLDQIIRQQSFSLTNYGRYFYRSKIGAIQYTGRINCIKILNWLYDDATIFLNRKYERFLEYLRMPFRDRNTSGESPCELLESLRDKYNVI